MKRHLFLTGEKGVGKSTLIRVLLESWQGSLGGFFTVKTAGVLPGSNTVHLLQAGTEERPTLENLLFCCGDGGDAAERFNRLGCAALAGRQSAGLLVMDELGPHEVAARAFCAEVLRALEEPIPILGVLQRADTPFLRQIADHPQVRVVEVTRDNRDGLAASLFFPNLLSK